MVLVLLLESLEHEHVLELAHAVKPSAGMAVEMIEDHLLLRAMELRRRWLTFEPLKQIHFLNVQRTSYEAFEEVLGGQKEDEIWRYTQQICLVRKG